MQSDQTEQRAIGDLPLRQFLTYRLNRLHARLNAQAARYLAMHSNITLTEWRAVALMGDLGETTLTGLSREGQLDKGLLSRTIKSLIGQKIIQTRQDPNDQRVQHLKLTRKGQGLFKHLLPRMQARQKFLRGALDDAELQALFRAFDKLDRAAEVTEFPQ